MLECILCGKVIIQNDNPKHFAVCSSCNVMDLTENQKQTILNQKQILFKAKINQMNE